jgi:hypothetical protein
LGKALAEKDRVESTTACFLASELVQEKQRDTPKSFLFLVKSENKIFSDFIFLYLQYYGI